MRSGTLALVLLASLLGVGDAPAVTVQAGDVLMASGDGDNRIARIRPYSGESINTTFPYGLADAPKGLLVDVEADRMYMVGTFGKVIGQNIATNSQYYVSDWQGSVSVGSGLPIAGAVDLLERPDGTIVVLTPEEILEVDPVSGHRSLLFSFEAHPYHTGNGFLLLPDGDFVVSNTRRAKLWRVDGTTGALTNLSSGFAGDVVGTGHAFGAPACIVEGPSGHVYVVDSGYDAIFQVELATGNRTVLSHAAFGAGPWFEAPSCLALRSDGSLAVTDPGLDAVFVVDPTTGDRSIVASATVGSGPLPWNPDAIIEAPDGSLLVGGRGIFRIDPATGERSVFSPNDITNGYTHFDPEGFAWAADGSLLSDFVDWGTGVLALDPDTAARTRITLLSTRAPVGQGPPLVTGLVDLSLEPDGSLIHVGGAAIHHIAIPSGDRSLRVGSEQGEGPAFGNLTSSARGPGDLLYVADGVAASILAVDLATGDRSVVSGPGVGAGPPLGVAWALALESSESLLAFASGGLLRVAVADGDRELLWDHASDPGPGYPWQLTDMALEHDGRVVFSDLNMGFLRFDPATGVARIIAGYVPGVGPVGPGLPASDASSLAVVPGDPTRLPGLSAPGALLLAAGLALLGARQLGRRATPSR